MQDMYGTANGLATVVSVDGDRVELDHWVSGIWAGPEGALLSFVRGRDVSALGSIKAIDHGAQRLVIKTDGAIAPGDTLWFSQPFIPASAPDAD